MIPHVKRALGGAPEQHAQEAKVEEKRVGSALAKDDRVTVYQVDQWAMLTGSIPDEPSTKRKTTSKNIETEKDGEGIVSYWPGFEPVSGFC